MAFDNARIYYEMDYRRYARQDASVDLPQRKSANNDRFNPSDKYSGISGYDPIYNATECNLNRGRIIGIDTSERWDPFHHPFYFDADSNLVYGGSRDLRDSPFEQAVRRAYEQCLKRHHGKKPAPTLKKHYIGDSGQQAPPGKMLNSKAAGRLLAAGGVYNGNVAGFRKTAEQLGGDAVKGYDQVLNEKTSGSMIATASVLLAKTARSPLTRGKLNSSLVDKNSLLLQKPVLVPSRGLPLSPGDKIVQDANTKLTSELDKALKGPEVGVDTDVITDGPSIVEARNKAEKSQAPNVAKDLTDAEKAAIGGSRTGTPGGFEPEEPKKDYKSELEKGDQIDLSTFNQRKAVSGSKGEFVDPKTGWKISPDRAGNNSHGGSSWKLLDKNGNRIATLDKNGSVLRK
ncbi:hypothetical protein [Serratia proteamaculans]